MCTPELDPDIAHFSFAQEGSVGKIRVLTVKKELRGVEGPKFRFGEEELLVGETVKVLEKPISALN